MPIDGRKSKPTSAPPPRSRARARAYTYVDTHAADWNARHADNTRVEHVPPPGRAVTIDMGLIVGDSLAPIYPDHVRIYMYRWILDVWTRTVDYRRVRRNAMTRAASRWKSNKTLMVMLLLRGTKNPFNASRREWGAISILTAPLRGWLFRLSDCNWIDHFSRENSRCFKVRVSRQAWENIR